VFRIRSCRRASVAAAVPAELDAKTDTPPDFERSPHRFEYEVLLEEYRTIRAEIIERLSNQQQIINFSLGLIAATFAVSQLLPRLDTVDGVFRSLRALYPFLSLLFSAFALMYLEHDVMMAYLGHYINRRLRPRLRDVILQASSHSVDVLTWDVFRGDVHIRIGLATTFHASMSLARYAVMIVPSVMLIVLHIRLALDEPILARWEWVVIIAAILLALWVCATALFATRQYQAFVLDEMHPEHKQSSTAVEAPRLGTPVLLPVNVLLLVLLTGYLGLGVAIATRQSQVQDFAQVDFNTYYAAARLFVEGQNISIPSPK
jgi:NADH:ubiquinone oxidoreductase subunit 6 (subunit J)